MRRFLITAVVALAGLGFAGNSALATPSPQATSASGCRTVGPTPKPPLYKDLALRSVTAIRISCAHARAVLSRWYYSHPRPRIRPDGTVTRYPAGWRCHTVLISTGNSVDTIYFDRITCRRRHAKITWTQPLP